MTNLRTSIPEDFHRITPYLRVTDAAAAIEFYKKAFGATEIMRLVYPDGRIAHAQIRIGDSPVMLADEHPALGILSPTSLGGTSVTIHQFVEDVDAVVEQAVAAGARQQTPVTDEFYGERECRIEDPFGHVWLLSTWIEDVPPEEMQRRLDELMAQESPI